MSGAPLPPGMMQQPLPGAKPFHRTILVSILAVFVIILGVLMILIGLAIALIGGIGGVVIGLAMLGAVAAVIGIIIAAVGGLTLVIGLGLWRQRAWAWWLAAIVDVLVLLSTASSGALRAAVVAGLVMLYLILVKKHFR